MDVDAHTHASKHACLVAHHAHIMHTESWLQRAAPVSGVP